MKEKFPIVFKDGGAIHYEVDKYGYIEMFKDKCSIYRFAITLPLLEQAMEKSKEIRKGIQ
jgi:hypothetical protein